MVLLHSLWAVKRCLWKDCSKDTKVWRILQDSPGLSWCWWALWPSCGVCSNQHSPNLITDPEREPKQERCLIQWGTTGEILPHKNMHDLLYIILSAIPVKQKLSSLPLCRSENWGSEDFYLWQPGNKSSWAPGKWNRHTSSLRHTMVEMGKLQNTKDKKISEKQTKKRK